jgi:hypothetical protein
LNPALIWEAPRIHRAPNPKQKTTGRHQAGDALRACASPNAGRRTMGILSERGLQADVRQQKLSGAHSSKLAHDDILHIKAVLRRLSTQDMNDLGLPPGYWRKRLRDLMQTHQLSNGQFDEIDQLLASLKE